MKFKPSNNELLHKQLLHKVGNLKFLCYNHYMQLDVRKAEELQKP